MRRYALYFFAFLLSLFFCGCGSGVSGRGPLGGIQNNNRPTRTLPPGGTAGLGGNSVTLVANDKGNVKHLNVRVMLPPGTTESLLDYNGTADLVGSISTESNAVPCLSGQAVSFRCPGQFTGTGNITSRCQIGAHQFGLRIVLMRPKHFKADFQLAKSLDYSVVGVELHPSHSCYFSRGANYPHAGGLPPYLP